MEIEKDTMMKRLELFFEEKRLDSFQFWPFSDKDACNTKKYNLKKLITNKKQLNVSCFGTKLAEAGFFWTGTKDEPDAAQCFVCNKSLDGWESTDNPWEEHKKHAPQCLFVSYYKKEEDLTLEQMYNLYRAMVKNMANLAVNDYKKKLMAHADDIRQELVTFKNEKKYK